MGSFVGDQMIKYGLTHDTTVSPNYDTIADQLEADQDHDTTSAYPDPHRYHLQPTAQDLPHQDHERDDDDEDRTAEELGPYKEAMYRIASMRPVPNDAVAGKQERRNARVSEDPQSSAARQRRDRIGQRIRILRSMVPGGSHMDTASMLDEAASYIKYLKRQVRLLSRGHPPPPMFADSDGSCANL